MSMWKFCPIISPEDCKNWSSSEAHNYLEVRVHSTTTWTNIYCQPHPTRVYKNGQITYLLTLVTWPRTDFLLTPHPPLLVRQLLNNPWPKVFNSATVSYCEYARVNASMAQYSVEWYVSTLQCKIWTKIGKCLGKLK